MEVKYSRFAARVFDAWCYLRRKLDEMAQSELPERANKRGGPGWWMDLDGSWRPPEEWPEDVPPLDGWVRGADGAWEAPKHDADNTDTSNSANSNTANSNTRGSDTKTRSPLQRAARTATPAGADAVGSSESDAKAQGRSRQAQADRKAILTVVGALGAAALVLTAALILITQAGADEDPEAEVGGAVIFAADTEELRMERRMELAADAHRTAQTQLDALVAYEPRTDNGAPAGAPAFDALQWIAARTDCLDVAEAVLVAKSQSPVVWADQLECVPDKGRWTDRYLKSTITRTLDADVRLHVPASIAHVSGGHQWNDATLQAYLTDVRHPATLQITTTGGGHNPREQGPTDWKPSDRSTWCAYAIDWVAVKDRWQLAVTNTERASLGEMLDTCESVDSAGPDPYTMPIDVSGPPSIQLISDQ